MSHSCCPVAQLGCSRTSSRVLSQSGGNPGEPGLRIAARTDLVCVRVHTEVWMDGFQSCSIIHGFGLLDGTGCDGGLAELGRGGLVLQLPYQCMYLPIPRGEPLILSFRLGIDGGRSLSSYFFFLRHLASSLSRHSHRPSKSTFVPTLTTLESKHRACA